MPKKSQIAAKILLVEDDPDFAEVLQEALTERGYTLALAGDGEAALAQLDRFAPDLILSDVQMHPLDGYGLLAALRERRQAPPVLMMTAWGTIEEAVRALQGGAIDYLVKPFALERLEEKIQKHLRERGAHGAELIAEAPAMRQCLERARKVAQSDATVLLHGESGVGKEVLARYIHRHSPRAQGPFVAVNCAAIPESLLEATLFGHEKGAFTGATQASAGKFEQAQGGTLLLDEVTEMPLPLQAKLLRVLQERELERVGGQRLIRLDIRVLATSNRDLEAAVRSGEFRADLFYRLQVFPLLIPPLRERREDIIPLAEYLIEAAAENLGLRPRRLSPMAARVLLAHEWPGNVRELQNALQRALILAEGEELQPGDLDLPIALLEEEIPMNPSSKSAADLALGVQKGQYERELIASALQQTGGAREAAARLLGISARTLRHKLQRLREAGFDLG
ncbi:sigma-54 dependent transcriptional regulator [Candidatus Igneacidithiobacillus taiwanensis]|uniref:sigma-54-dependent transcriptional regulator n=1 Tax=Candidatus Igneacidithiobacillus taiwanensis TaxID=1945924 RepID=UPI002897DE20|nr:sigma-54 dependent transcriptional regulator [Candidatus Igneacidithiobacillus taiwanensis]